MKRLSILLLAIAFSAPVFAQFPLGSNASEIKTYFAVNIPYSSLQEYKTLTEGDVLCFTKTRVVGDYTFYFNKSGSCTSYIVTYDAKELNNVIKRFDNKFCKLHDAEWESEEGDYTVAITPPNPGANYFSVTYKPLPGIVSYQYNTLASN